MSCAENVETESPKSGAPTRETHPRVVSSESGDEQARAHSERQHFKRHGLHMFIWYNVQSVTLSWRCWFQFFLLLTRPVPKLVLDADVQAEALPLPAELTGPSVTDDVDDSVVNPAAALVQILTREREEALCAFSRSSTVGASLVCHSLFGPLILITKSVCVSASEQRKTPGGVPPLSV